jgi:hypothetical protein
MFLPGVGGHEQTSCCSSDHHIDGCPYGGTSAGSNTMPCYRSDPDPSECKDESGRSRRRYVEKRDAGIGAQLCGVHMAGANCSNRGCDMSIYKEISKGSWRKTFHEHLYGKFLAIDWERMHLQLMVASIYAGDPRCQPIPNKEYTSGKSCNLIVTYRNNNWDKVALSLSRAAPPSPQTSPALMCNSVTQRHSTACRKAASSTATTTTRLLPTILRL